MTQSRFLAKIGKDLYRRVCQILSEVKDPRLEGALVTVSRVEISADLRILSCHVVVQGSPKHQKAILDVLSRARRFVRMRLGEHLDLRYTPEVRFFLDEGPDRAQRIEEILREVKAAGASVEVADSRSAPRDHAGDAAARPDGTRNA